MVDMYLLAIASTAVSAMTIGVLAHHSWRARAARARRRIPPRWNLTPRPLLSEAEHEVWHWLRRAFFEHHVLVKLPVVRFLSPRSTAEGQRSHELLNGIHCSFTVCASDGTVIGCLDVPGRQGLRASTRNLKQKLFAECGLAYAVVRAGNLPTLEAMRAAFLGEIDLTEDAPRAANDSVAASHPDVDTDALTVPAQLAAVAEVGVERPQVDMLAVAEARSSLRAKLERNRKTHFTNFDPISTGSGIVHDGADHQFVVQWEDSFITAEDEAPPPPPQA